MPPWAGDGMAQPCSTGKGERELQAGASLEHPCQGVCPGQAHPLPAPRLDLHQTHIPSLSLWIPCRHSSIQLPLCPERVQSATSPAATHPSLIRQCILQPGCTQGTLLMSLGAQSCPQRRGSPINPACIPPQWGLRHCRKLLGKRAHREGGRGWDRPMGCPHTVPWGEARASQSHLPGTCTCWD